MVIGFLHDFVDCVGVGDVQSKRKALDAKLFGDLFGDFLEFLESARDGYDVAALVREGFRHLDAQSAGTTGDDGDAAGKVKILFHDGSTPWVIQLGLVYCNFRLTFFCQSFLLTA